MTRVSCVIPAYNEGARIGNVLAAVVGHPLIDEIIVVDDGSDDDTREQARKFPSVTLLVNKTNGGKSGAIAKGVPAAKGTYLLLLDADLVGLVPEDITRLIEPVLAGAAEFSISLRRDALLPWRAIGLDYLSGERVMRRALVADHLEAIARLPGFGFETYLNTLTIESGGALRIVKWKGVDHTHKIRKYGFWRGVLGEMRMLMNILETVSLFGTGPQILAMLKAGRQAPQG